MELRIIIVFSAVILTAASQSDEKIYRKDYVYDWGTDAFYKLHVDSGSRLSRSEVCEFEGATLVTAMSEQELSGVRKKMNQYQQYTEDDGDLAERQPIINYSDADDVLEMRCQLTTRDGFVQTSSIFRNRTLFVCKVEANNIPYNSLCRVYAKDYNYFGSVDSCYKIPRVAYTWNEAYAECQAEGAHLVVINSETERAVVQNFAKSVSKVDGAETWWFFFAGLRAPETATPRLFKTVLDQTLEEAGFAEWSEHEPNNAPPGEYCVSIFINDGKYNDINCAKRYAFICEKEV